jgi:hypothetical protein
VRSEKGRRSKIFAYFQHSATQYVMGVRTGGVQRTDGKETDEAQKSDGSTSRARNIPRSKSCAYLSPFVREADTLRQSSCKPTQRKSLRE